MKKLLLILVAILMFCSCAQVHEKIEFVEGIHYPFLMKVSYGEILTEIPGTISSWDFPGNEEYDPYAIESVIEHPLDLKDIASFSAGTEETVFDKRNYFIISHCSVKNYAYPMFLVHMIGRNDRRKNVFPEFAGHGLDFKVYPDFAATFINCGKHFVVAFMAHYRPVNVFERIIFERIFKTKADFYRFITGKHMITSVFDYSAKKERKQFRSF